jgi:hypothetical protein
MNAPSFSMEWRLSLTKETPFHSCQNEQGIWIHDHHGKAGLLWQSFKKRMGISSNPVMIFDLS